MRFTQFVGVIAAMIIAGNTIASSPTLELSSFGIKADGRSDDTTAVQHAIDTVAKAGGGTVLLPSGRYLIAGSLSVPSGVTLSGEWQAPHHEDVVFGTVLFATGGKDADLGPALIELEPSACVKGLTVFYPEQDSANVHPYPFTIRGRGMHPSVIDVTLVNSYRGIDFSTKHELHYIRNLFGTVLREGIVIDHCTDIGRIENVHFNPHYWFRCQKVEGTPAIDSNKIVDYMMQNLDAFVFARTDWEYVLNTFCFGYKTCYKFVHRQAGACNGNFVGIGADAGQYAIWAEASQPMGIQITNGEFVSMYGDDATQIVTTPSFHGVLNLNNCAFWGPSKAIAKLDGPGHVSFNQCNFINSGKGGGTAPAFSVDRGSFQMTGCRVSLENKSYFEFKPQAKSAIVNATWFAKKIGLASDGSTTISLTGNVEMGE